MKFLVFAAESSRNVSPSVAAEHVKTTVDHTVSYTRCNCVNLTFYISHYFPTVIILQLLFTLFGEKRQYFWFVSRPTEHKPAHACWMLTCHPHHTCLLRWRRGLSGILRETSFLRQGECFPNHVSFRRGQILATERVKHDLTRWTWTRLCRDRGRDGKSGFWACCWACAPPYETSFHSLLSSSIWWCR